MFVLDTREYEHIILQRNFPPTMNTQEIVLFSSSPHVKVEASPYLKTQVNAQKKAGSGYTTLYYVDIVDRNNFAAEDDHAIHFKDEDKGSVRLFFSSYIAPSNFCLGAVRYLSRRGTNKLPPHYFGCSACHYFVYYLLRYSLPKLPSLPPPLSPSRDSYLYYYSIIPNTIPATSTISTAPTTATTKPNPKHPILRLWWCFFSLCLSFIFLFYPSSRFSKYPLSFPHQHKQYL